VALRVRVCRLDEIRPDEVNAFRVTGVTWPVIVTRIGGNDGELVATAGVCPHEDVSLADGHVDGDTLVCPGHGYGFDLNSGRCRHDASLVLRRYAVTVVGDEVWVDLLKDP
jgi:nitrite reductase/ring-hydroxylating ferredoxin subunit